MFGNSGGFMGRYTDFAADEGDEMQQPDEEVIDLEPGNEQRMMAMTGQMQEQQQQQQQRVMRGNMTGPTPLMSQRFTAANLIQQLQHPQQMMRSSGSSDNNHMMLLQMRQDIANVKAMCTDLQAEKDGLRNGIRKLKIENTRLKQRMNRMAEVIKKHTGQSLDDLDDMALDDADFDGIRDFLLIGGPLDPLGLRFDAKIIDPQNKEHKSSERYFWYKMALTFGDTASAEKIRLAATTQEAEEYMKGIANFDENTWNGIKLREWEEAQRMKFEQNRHLMNLLVLTGQSYLAVAAQDKVFGTGWRKNRDEAMRPKMWDGDNGGGKCLMKMRDTFKTGHTWNPGEQEATERQFNELIRQTWRRPVDQSRGSAMGGGMRGGMRGSYRGGGGGTQTMRGMPAKRARW